MSNKKRKKKNYIPIQTLIAFNNTDEALRLLERNGYKANSLNDIQIQLTELYKNSPDKMEIERQFVEIHPHKNLILKHLAPKESKEDKTIVEVSKPTEEQVNKEIRNTVVHDGYSSCEGNPNCSCNKKSNFSSACGCSGFDGTGKQSTQPAKVDNSFNSIVVLGIVAIFGMLIYKNKI